MTRNIGIRQRMDERGGDVTAYVFTPEFYRVTLHFIPPSLGPGTHHILLT